MAKINARGAREVARWEAVLSGADGERTFSYRYLVVLTSDGRLLRRVADDKLQSGYSILATFKPTTKHPANLPGDNVNALRAAKVERYLAQRGYVVTPMAVR